ncbi:universal stress protein UspA [Devosia pacifica]|uniref:Universal stress protein UspA n=1 Tax=Devosia pacifica TaxID=1335967 RepID=A0A918VS87_9HYPH|nr:universal stress protein [Devosia pacifica]GHA18110.1 universal stress protein UspA [Devosia pacifica]
MKLIAFIDGSTYSESVLDYAAWVSERTDAQAEIVHVIGRRETSTPPVSFSGSLEAGAHQHLLEELSKHDEQRARLAQQRGRLLVDSAVERLQEAGLKEVAARLRTGDIVEAVQDMESGADMIMIGKRGEAADFAKLHLGSNLERVARVSTKPVFVANRKFKPIERFLIAFDGGASVMKAINHIATSKLFAGLPCTMISAGRETQDMRGKLEAAAGVLRSSGFEVQTLIEEGQPEEVISRHTEASGIDLLVMGAYSHSRVRSLFIGSTTAEMVRSVLIPVMLFR